MNTLEIVEGKFERRLGTESSRLKDEISLTRSNLQDEMSNIRIEIANSRSQLIKWMFAFYTAQMASMVGILFAFFKH